MIVETAEFTFARRIDACRRELVTRSDVAAGRRWYREARRTARAIASEAGVSERVAAGVIACLSPRCAWPVNVAAARTLLGVTPDGPLSGTHANVRKAQRVAGGELSAITGPKVSRFYRNMLGDGDAVTVDVWACRIAYDDPRRDIAPNEAQVAVLERAYRLAASWCGLRPRELQASTWIAYRRAHGADWGADF